MFRVLIKRWTGSQFEIIDAHEFATQEEARAFRDVRRETTPEDPYWLDHIVVVADEHFATLLAPHEAYFDTPPEEASEPVVQVASLADLVPDREPVYQALGGSRSPRWPLVRQQFLKVHPHCEACGTATLLDVHHVQPYHVHPELELDLGNLFTLCRICHFYFGHGKSWTKWLPDVREEAHRYRARLVRAQH